MTVRAQQCAACPWRVDVVPKRDIPGGYCEEKHRRLEATLVDPADPTRSLNGPLMACHETSAGRELVCTGYAANQLEAGHLKLRIFAMQGRIPELRLAGPQHKTLADSLAANKDE
jgi:hypothetical protein